MLVKTETRSPTENNTKSVANIKSVNLNDRPKDADNTIESVAKLKDTTKISDSETDNQNCMNKDISNDDISPNYATKEKRENDDKDSSLTDRLSGDDIQPTYIRTADREICTRFDANAKENSDKNSLFDSNKLNYQGNDSAISENIDNVSRILDDAHNKLVNETDGSDISCVKDLIDKTMDLDISNKLECNLECAVSNDDICSEIKTEITHDEKEITSDMKQKNEIEKDDSTKYNEINITIDKSQDNNDKNEENLTENIPYSTDLLKISKEMKNIFISGKFSSITDINKNKCNRCSDTKHCECFSISKEKIDRSGGDISNSDSRKTISDPDIASVDMNTAIGLINK